MKEYIFKKDYQLGENAKILKGMSLRFVRGQVYLDGMMMTPGAAVGLTKLFQDETFRQEYLEEREIIYNKV